MSRREEVKAAYRLIVEEFKIADARAKEHGFLGVQSVSARHSGVDATGKTVHYRVTIEVEEPEAPNGTVH